MEYNNGFTALFKLRNTIGILIVTFCNLYSNTKEHVLISSAPQDHRHTHDTRGHIKVQHLLSIL